MMSARLKYSLSFAAAVSVAISVAIGAAMAQTPAKDRTLGYDDTPMLPGQPYRVHDIKRPHPRDVTPAARLGDPPSDAIVLFDGSNMSVSYTHLRAHETG